MNRMPGVCSTRRRTTHSIRMRLAEARRWVAGKRPIHRSDGVNQRMSVGNRTGQAPAAIRSASMPGSSCSTARSPPAQKVCRCRACGTPVAEVRLVGQPVPFDHGDFGEVVGERPGGENAGHAATDHGGVPGAVRGHEFPWLTCEYISSSRP